MKPCWCWAAAGGVGLATIQLAKAMGARVIAAASSDEKLAVTGQWCRRAGELQQRRLARAHQTITDGKGVDVIYDPVGGDYAEPGDAADGVERALSGGGFCRRRYPGKSR